MPVKMRPLFIQDVKTLKTFLSPSYPAAALNPKTKRMSLNSFESYIRRAKASDNVWTSVFYKDKPDDTENVLALVMGQKSLSGQGLQLLDIYFNPASSSTPDQADYKEIIKNLFLQASTDGEIKGIVLACSKQSKLFWDTLEVYTSDFSPWNPVALDAERDAITFTKINSWPQSWAFVPSPVGLIAVKADTEKILQVEWLDYRKKIENPEIKDLAASDGYADAKGYLLGKKETHDLFDSARKVSERLLFPLLKEAQSQLYQYIRGERKSFDLPLLDQEGTPLQKAVWQAIKEIPYGDAVSYEEIALRITDRDEERARNLTRAVGAACGANAIGIIIPCHRVIAKDGKLQGYAYGVKKKDWLLAMEVMGFKPKDR